MTRGCWAGWAVVLLLACGVPVRAEVPWHDAPEALAPAEGAAGARERLLQDPSLKDLPAAQDPENLLWDMGKTALALAVVCGLVWVSLKFGIPGLSGQRFAGRDRFRVLDRFGLEPKKMLYVVEVYGRRILLASSENTVAFLADLDAPGAAAAGREPGTPAKGGAEPAGESKSFYSILQRKLDRPTVERTESESLSAAPGSIRGEVS